MRTMARRWLMIVAAGGAVLCSPGAAADELADADSEPRREEGASAGKRRAWYVPDQAKLQLAGNIGFVSPSFGYAWFGRRLESDLYFGWVPAAVGGEDIWSVTAKLTALPWRVDMRRGWRVQPLTVAVQLNYTFGDEYWIVEPARYPGQYYPLPTALRAGFAVGSTVSRPVWRFERVGVYYELVALDTALGLWAGNPRTLSVTDVFTLALGARAEL